MWRAYLADTMTGLIDSPLDLPSFSWSMSIGDFALTTTRGKDVGGRGLGDPGAVERRPRFDAIGASPGGVRRQAFGCFCSIGS